MSNTIKLDMSFSFKGDTFYPSTILDLDSLMSNHSLEVIHQESNILSFIYPLLAASIDLDTYSYAYESMLASHVVYSQPTGIAVNHLSEEQFNYVTFHQEWLTKKVFNIIEKIAKTHLSVVNLEQQPHLKSALLEAFYAGKKAV